MSTVQKVVIRSLIEGARQATGTVVLIDVFTSTTLAATLLARGARDVVPVLAARKARALKVADPEVLLIGERFGKKLPGFAHNTSAVHADALDVRGRRIALTTTNGTLGMLGAQQADRVLLGCFRNLTAVARAVRGSAEISLVPIGIAFGRVRAIEDELCATVLRNALEGRPLGSDLAIRRIRRDLSSRLRNVGRSEDVAFCLHVDAIDVVPVLEDGRLTNL